MTRSLEVMRRHRYGTRTAAQTSTIRRTRLGGTLSPAPDLTCTRSQYSSPSVCMPACTQQSARGGAVRGVPPSSTTTTSSSSCIVHHASCIIIHGSINRRRAIRHSPAPPSTGGIDTAEGGERVVGEVARQPDAPLVRLRPLRTCAHPPPVQPRHQPTATTDVRRRVAAPPAGTCRHAPRERRARSREEE